MFVVAFTCVYVCVRGWGWGVEQHVQSLISACSCVHVSIRKCVCARVGVGGGTTCFEHSEECMNMQCVLCGRS